MNACYFLEPTSMKTLYENKMAGFVENQCSVRQGVGLNRKVFCYMSCSCLPTRKIGTHCVDVGSALKNNVVQAGLVFDVVLYLPNLSRSRYLINKEILQNLKYKFLTDRSKLHVR